MVTILEGKRGPRSDGRLFIAALLGMGRSGARWRDLPERFGPCERAKQRSCRWLRGVLARIFEAVAAEILGFEAVHPLARGARADACGSCGGLRRLPALKHGAHDPLSTKRRQTGILMDVHPALRGTLKCGNSSFFGSGRMRPAPLPWP